MRNMSPNLHALMGHRVHQFIAATANTAGSAAGVG